MGPKPISIDRVSTKKLTAALRFMARPEVPPLMCNWAETLSVCNRLQQILYNYNLYVSAPSYTVCKRCRKLAYVGTFGAKAVRSHINREQGFWNWLVGCTKGRRAVCR